MAAIALSQRTFLRVRACGHIGYLSGGCPRLQSSCSAALALTATQTLPHRCACYFSELVDQLEQELKRKKYNKGGFMQASTVHRCTYVLG